MLEILLEINKTILGGPLNYLLELEYKTPIFIQFIILILIVVGVYVSFKKTYYSEDLYRFLVAFTGLFFIMPRLLMQVIDNNIVLMLVIYPMTIYLFFMIISFFTSLIWKIIKKNIFKTDVLAFSKNSMGIYKNEKNETSK